MLAVMRIAFLSLIIAAVSAAPSAVESNVVYGMYSGTALLLDVHRPEKPNGYGVIYISGSGWTAPMAYSAPPLKSNEQSLQYAKPLVEAGYTVFTINHRATPRFRYPAAIEDAQRAVRFIRHNASRYGIRPDRIGAVGGSSGGHLVSMLGTLDGQGRANDPDPVERESSRVQCVVARAAPTDLLKLPSNPFVAMSVPTGDEATQKASEEYRTLAIASPISHISPDDPPFFLIHGDKDLRVPFEQSIEFEKALRGAGIPVHLLRIPGGGHGATFPGAVNPPNYLKAMVEWVDRHLKVK